MKNCYRFSFPKYRHWSSSEFERMLACALEYGREDLNC